MIVVQGNNPIGNVIHLIMGPESDLIQDVHGAIILDVTEVVNSLSRDSKTFVSISKCRNESMTGSLMNSAGLKFNGTFPQIMPGSKACECDECKKASKDKPTETKPEESVTVALKEGICSYCHAKTRLMPIAGESICMPCAQIELGLKKKKAVRGSSHSV